MAVRPGALARRLLVLLVWLVAFIVFIRIHRGLSVAGNTYGVGAAGVRSVDRAAIRLDVGLAAIRFFGASLAMAALLLGARRRILFALPVVMTVSLPALFGGVPDCWAFDQARAPHGIGPGWNYTAPISGCGYQLFANWSGVAVDLALVVVPFLILAIVVGRRRQAVTSIARRPASSVVALAVALIGVIFAMSVREQMGYGTDWFVWLGIHIPLVTFGAMLGLRRSWWSLALLVVPLSLFPIQAGMPYSFDGWGAAYLIAITLTAASWRPLAGLAERGRGLLARLSRRPVAVPAGS